MFHILPWENASKILATLSDLPSSNGLDWGGKRQEGRNRAANQQRSADPTSAKSPGRVPAAEHIVWHDNVYFSQFILELQEHIKENIKYVYLELISQFMLSHHRIICYTFWLLWITRKLHQPEHLCMAGEIWVKQMY